MYEYMHGLRFAGRSLGERAKNLLREHRRCGLKPRILQAFRPTRSRMPAPTPGTRPFPPHAYRPHDPAVADRPQSDPLSTATTPGPSPRLPLPKTPPSAFHLDTHRVRPCYLDHVHPASDRYQPQSHSTGPTPSPHPTLTTSVPSSAHTITSSTCTIISNSSSVWNRCSRKCSSKSFIWSHKSRRRCRTMLPGGLLGAWESFKRLGGVGRLHSTRGKPSRATSVL